MIAAIDRPAAQMIARRSPGRPRRTNDPFDFASMDHIRKHQAALLIAHMLIEDKLDINAIRFLVKIYPLFFDNKTVSSKMMAAAYGATPQAAVPYVKALTEAGLLVRLSYRSWELSDTYLTYLNKM